MAPITRTAIPSPSPSASPSAGPSATPTTTAPTTAGPTRTGARAERRALARSATRTAVLTVALPSAATLGVFAAAAAAVQHDSAHRGPSSAPAPSGPVPARPSGGGAEQTAAERREALRRAAERAEQTERADRERARADLMERKEEERRRENSRPRYVLPVEQRGLTARFGQAGTHWTARHTGVDFPVPTGTPVLAVTDGTVSTRWSAAYGYLATVTAADGTQTWYGHLRSYRVRKGQVRAGEVIAYSGSSGNSTGPHLHFEVRPGGEDPVDPVPWLLAHGLDPR